MCARKGLTRDFVPNSGTCCANVWCRPVSSRPLVLGHRGASRRARENTLEAFEIARSLGADGVELDVRLTADGAAVVHHDPVVEGYGLIRAVPFAQLRRDQPHVPTLDEALDVLAGALVNIEMKCLPWDPDPDPDGAVPALVAQTVDVRGIRDEVVVSSFDLEAVGAVRAIDARIATGWLTSRLAVETSAPFAVLRGVTWLHPDRGEMVADPSGAVRAAKEHGLRVDVWTVNDPDEMRALAGAGVDALITDVPDVALEVLG
jgi:glycerophosphoryl diester phosphodiesterase